MKIVGITGTPGAGKGTITNYLVNKKGFVHYSASGFITEEILRRGLKINRDSMNLVSNDLRKKYSSSYIIEQLLLRAKETGKDAVIEALRTVDEAKTLQTEGATILAIDADQHLRYERILSRKSAKDNVCFEEFVKQEEKENHSSDPTEQNVMGVMKIADIHLTNNGTKKELEEKLEIALAKL